MGLVEYSESEGSDTEARPKTASSPKPASSSTSKPTFQKVVDRSNPHQIRVHLPEASKAEADHHEGDGGERSAKRPKTGGGAFSGFNSFLPAPKRPLRTSHAGSQPGEGPMRGLGSGVNLKTGPSPGFSREPRPELLDEDAKGDSHIPSSDVPAQHQDVMNGHDEIHASAASEVPKQQIPRSGPPMMFKPLSVARKPKKKKAGLTAESASSIGNPANAAKLAKTAPTVSLFSLNPEKNDAQPTVSSSNEYKPLIYDAAPVKPASPSPTPPTVVPVEDDMAPNPPSTYSNTTSLSSNTQSLDSIASDLNLSASAKRQLFGRQRGSNPANASAINIFNFNTDEEYAANEALRAAGEQVQHNPVRAIAPGKHSLKQLVNAASTQKDALEEHFASGKRNKKEAGSRYGW